MDKSKVKLAAKVHLVAGTRPNIIKIAPLYHTLSRQRWGVPKIIWFTQHFTPSLSRENFEDLGVVQPEVVIEVANGRFGSRLGSIIEGYQRHCEVDRPDFVVVAGDVDTSLGVALAARRLDIPVVHLEAGLRSYEPSMPEEANRILIDSISDVWLVPSEAAQQNLVMYEGKPPERVHFVGNIMIDALKSMLDESLQSDLSSQYGLDGRKFGIATFHRPANVDRLDRAQWIVETLRHISNLDHTIVFPVHPRTRDKLDALGLLPALNNITNVLVLPSLRYKKFINLLAQAEFILTDSGGVQEEAAFLKKRCFTLRETTERPVTIYAGSNHLVNQENAHDIISALLTSGSLQVPVADIPLWDGLTSQRCSHVVARWWAQVSTNT